MPVPEQLFNHFYAGAAFACRENLSDFSAETGRLIAAEFLRKNPRKKISRFDFPERLREFFIADLGLAVAIKIHLDEHGFSMMAESYRLADAARFAKMIQLDEYDPFVEAVRYLLGDLFKIKISEIEREWVDRNDYEVRINFTAPAGDAIQ